MGMKRTGMQFVIRDGRPAAVIVDIDQYEEMLERLEDLEDLEALREMRSKPLEFRKLADFLEEYDPGVRDTAGASS